ncbi:MAG: HAD family hydrolase [Maritimibacter sp.]
MSGKISTIAFDADDTLWQNEQFFKLTQARFAALLAEFADPDHLTERLMAAERRNLGQYGFGIKGFVLSMIETAIEVTDQKVPARVIAELISAGQEMLAHPIELLPEVERTIVSLASDHHIMMITKGDLLDQERKLAQSGLGELFASVEIVSDKTPAVYGRIFAQCAGGAEAAMMVGNSVKSDVIPALSIGAWGVHVPHHLTWAYEHAEAPISQARYREIASLGDLPELIDGL